jgi:choline dehydrogenase-like flavoprotein
MTGQEFDFVIVGAGSSGCVLANRLSADPECRVALLEAGPRDRSFWIHLPIGYGRTMWDPKVNWKFQTEPEPNMNQRQIYWPRGRVVGGSSSINGLIVIRGQKEDYDSWKALGCPGWSWNEVLPYFIRLENNAEFGDDQNHGNNGPLPISSIGRKNDLIEAFIASAEANGVPGTNDFNGPTQEGVGYFQLTTKNGWRMSAAAAYLRPVRGRKNLHIIPNTRVLRVVFEGHRAVGVECHSPKGAYTFKAKFGVVLSAGAIQSPQLLMLSGIGSGKDLRQCGVPILIDRPAVGQNLHDHLQFRLIFKANKAITTNDQLRSMWGCAKLALEWLLFRKGALAVGINQGGLFVRLLPESQTPDIQFHVATLSADVAGGKVHDFSGFTLSVCQLRPESRGHISLASADPLARPLIYANYLASEKDRNYAVKSIHFARKIAETKPLADLIAAEVMPGPSVRSDSEVLDFARRNGTTIFHPAGTCRMGTDGGAVVDPRLHVRGVTGLWVADCSVMPTLVSGNTNVPAIMIGEKAADMVLEDYKENHLSI